MKPQLNFALDASVSSTFGVLAWEIELASARCLMLDDMVGDLMLNLPPDQQFRLTRGMHMIDLVCQQLTSLSAFARNMSGQVAEDVRAPVCGAIGDMTLGALADRMSTALGGEEKGLDDGAGAGDLDLF